MGLRNPEKYSLKLTPSERALIEDVLVIIAYDYDTFDQENNDINTTLHRFNLSFADVRLKKLIEKLKNLKLPRNEQLSELYNLSIEQIEEARKRISEVLEQKRREAGGKRINKEPRDNSAIRHFKEAIKRLKGG